MVTVVYIPELLVGSLYEHFKVDRTYLMANEKTFT